MITDTFGCVDNTIRVASGGYINLSDPDPRKIRISDIATGLGNICRFGGQTRFYSVAEHCIHAASLASRDGCSQRECLAVLLHDAAEAYVGDMVKPLKNMVAGVYHEVEQAFEEAIADRFGISIRRHVDVIKKYDRELLIAEKFFLQPSDNIAWKGEDNVRRVKVPFACWSPEESRKRFLRAFFELRHPTWKFEEQAVS